MENINGVPTKVSYLYTAWAAALHEFASYDFASRTSEGGVVSTKIEI